MQRIANNVAATKAGLLGAWLLLARAFRALRDGAPGSADHERWWAALMTDRTPLTDRLDAGR